MPQAGPDTEDRATSRSHIILAGESLETWPRMRKGTLHSGIMVMGGLIGGFRQSHLWIGLRLNSHHRNPLMPISSLDFVGFFFKHFPPTIKSLSGLVSPTSLVYSSHTLAKIYLSFYYKPISNYLVISSCCVCRMSLERYPEM
jgi:hypothetical protein